MLTPLRPRQRSAPGSRVNGRSAPLLLSLLLPLLPLLNATSSVGGSSSTAPPLTFWDDQANVTIPRIIHTYFMNGEEALDALSQRLDTPWPREWRESCRTLHPGWAFKAWDARSARALAARDYPFLLPAFKKYGHPVQRADATRWMALHAFGGLYLDTDVECLSPVGPSLAGRDLVLNCETRPGGGRDGAGNAAVASTARNPFWLEVMGEALRRAADPSYAQHENGFVRVLATTGPWMVTDVLRRFFRVAPDGPLCGVPLTAAGATRGPAVRAIVYPASKWFTPCLPDDAACELDWARRRVRARGAESARRAAVTAAGHPVTTAWGPGDAAGVVGFHHYGATWHRGTDRGRAFRRGAAAAAREAAALFGDGDAFREWDCAAHGPPLSPLPLPVASEDDSPDSSAAADTNANAAHQRRRRRLQEESAAAAASEQQPAVGTAAAVGESVAAPTGPPPSAPAPAATREAAPFICEEFVADAIGGGECTVFVITGTDRHPAAVGNSAAAARGNRTAGRRHAAVAPFDASLAARLRARGCLLVHIGPSAGPPPALMLSSSQAAVSSEPASPGKASTPAGDVLHIRAAVGAATARLADPPVLSLSDALKEAASAAARRLGLVPDLAHGEGARRGSSANGPVPRPVLLQLACGGCEWDALAAFAVEASAPALLGGAGALLLESPSRPPADHQAAAVHALMYQRLGFVGYLHQPLPGGALRLGWVRQPAWRVAARAAVAEQ